MFLIAFLIAQASGDNPLMSLPPPADKPWWWPLLMWALPLLVTGLAGWYSLRVKRKEKEAEGRVNLAISETELRIKQLETDAEQRDKVFEMLRKQVDQANELRQSDLKESRELRNELRLAREELATRDSKIIELTSTVETLKRRVRQLEKVAVE